MFTILAIGTGIAILTVFTGTVPRQACFAKFRWEDCGKPPVPVVYYWKPGSRCEVGMWRGCLPNLNMFKNEYECVSTCIFRVQAEASDYHQQNDFEEIRSPSTVETTCKNDHTSPTSDDISDGKPTEGPNDDQDGNNVVDPVTEVNNEGDSNIGSDTSDKPDNIDSTNADDDGDKTTNSGGSDGDNKVTGTITSSTITSIVSTNTPSTIENVNGD